MRSNSTLLLTLKPYPPKCVQWPELKGVDEVGCLDLDDIVKCLQEAAVFMNRLPPARKPEIWKILNTSMPCREKLSVLEDDLNRGEVKLVKKWILRRLPPKELFYYSIIYSIYMAVISYLFLRIKEVVQDGRLRDGRTGDWVWALPPRNVFLTVSQTCSLPSQHRVHLLLSLLEEI